jgi:hypothetical protein
LAAEASRSDLSRKLAAVGKSLVLDAEHCSLTFGRTDLERGLELELASACLGCIGTGRHCQGASNAWAVRTFVASVVALKDPDWLWTGHLLRRVEEGSYRHSRAAAADILDGHKPGATKADQGKPGRSADLKSWGWRRSLDEIHDDFGSFLVKK